MLRVGKILVAATLLAAPIVFAQTSDQAAPSNPAASAPTQPQPNQGRRDQVEARLRHMSKELNLTDDQKEKLKPILQNEADQMKSVQADSSLTPQQRKKKAHGIRKSFEPQVQAVLTSEQKEKLKSMKGQRHQNRRTRNASPDNSGSTEPQ